MSVKREKPAKWEKLNNKKSLLAALIILIIPLIIMYAGYIFENVRPMGVDSAASLATTRQYKLWESESGEKALWNPNVFTGMPTYHRITPKIPHADTAVHLLGRVTYVYFWYFLIGGMGMFLLLYSRKIPWYGAVVVALGFILLPHWQALIHVGHYSKIRAFMMMPWLLLSFQYLVNRRSWTGVGFFALMFSWMVRTQHVQVVFYGILFLLFLYLVPVLKHLFRKEYKRFGDLSLKIIIAVILTVLVSAQPFVSLQEYSEYSTRGGNPLKLGEEQETASRAKGVSLDYATRWSLAPKEILNFFFPRFFGGMSQEEYDGKTYSQLKGRTLPGYWGDMPFTQSYDSMGFLLFLFALIGVIRYYKLGQIKSLVIFALFTVLLGFGHHFMPLYKLFFYYFPYFSKFRVPVMITNMTFISLFILAGYGFKALLWDPPADRKEERIEMAVFGGGIVFILFLLLIRGQLSYTAPGEASRYPAETLEILRGVRKEFLTTDLLRALFVTVIAGGVITAYRLKKLAKFPLVLVLLGLVSVELGFITKKAYDQIPLGNEKVMERRQFSDTDITRALKRAPEGYRALVLGQGFQDNHYAYWYPIINGYSAIKLQLIQDAVDHLLFTGSGPAGVNWNVVNMLNGRFIIASGQLEQPFLKAVAMDKNRKEILYENSRALPKAWLIEKRESVNSWEEVVRKMNEEHFDPEKTAYTLNGEKEYSGEGSVRLIKASPNRFVFDVSIPDEQFLVISEIYYEEGWTANFKGKTLPIHQVYYLLRGIELPAGEGELVLSFKPPAYRRGVIVSWMGIFIVWLLIGGGFWLEHKRHSNRESHA